MVFGFPPHPLNNAQMMALAHNVFRRFASNTVVFSIAFPHWTWGAKHIAKRQNYCT
jgi:hypothetical protein